MAKEFAEEDSTWEKDHDVESLSSPSEALLSGSPTDWKDSKDSTERHESFIHSLFTVKNVFTGLKYISALLLALIPSFLRPSTAPRELHPTSWLDGLRGVAAFIVYLHHVTWMWFPGWSKGYASEVNTYSFLQWPFVRIFYSGRGMVTIFFVISGYALSYSSLKKIRNQDFERLLYTISSSTFRRWLRLYLPVLAATFISFLICRNGGSIGPWGGPGRRGTFIEQLRDWWRWFILITNPVQSMEGPTVFAHPYTFQLWTIPREFRGSLAIYIMIICFAMCKPAVRIIGITCFAHYLIWISCWDLYLFLIGMVLGELQLIYQDWSTNAKSRSAIFTEEAYQYIKPAKNTAKWTLSVFFLISSVHLLCYPDINATKTPGYMFLNWFTLSFFDPSLTQRFWLCIAAVMLLFTVCFSPSLPSGSTPLFQRPFTTRVAQYLGDISYSLYVCHAHIVFTIGNRVLNAYKGYGADSWSYSGGFCIALLVNTIGVIWLADVFWRVVDLRSVSLGKTLAAWCWVK